MKLLPYITFGLGVAFGYVIQFPATFEGVGKSVAGGLSVGFIYTIYKERKERLIAHSKLLVDKNLKQRTNNSLHFRDYAKFDLRIGTKENGSIQTPVDGTYSKEVDGHLESGYHEEVLKYEKERDSLIEEYNPKVQQFLDNVSSRIIIEVKQKIPSLIEWNPESLSIAIGSVFYKSFECGDVGDLDQYFAIKQENNRWRIFTNQVLAEGDNEKEIQKIKQIIKCVLEDALISEDFKMLKNYHKDIKRKNEFFVIAIYDIIKSVENNNPLKGHCKHCPKDIFSYIQLHWDATLRWMQRK